MTSNKNNGLRSSRQDALVQSLASQSYIATVCNAVMDTTCIVWLLVLLVGVLACHAGLQAGAVAVLNAWLIWPLGGLTCGIVALSLSDQE